MCVWGGDCVCVCVGGLGGILWVGGGRRCFFGGEVQLKLGAGGMSVVVSVVTWSHVGVG